MVGKDLSNRRRVAVSEFSLLLGNHVGLVDRALDHLLLLGVEILGQGLVQLRLFLLQVYFFVSDVLGEQEMLCILNKAALNRL